MIRKILGRIIKRIKIHAKLNTQKVKMGWFMKGIMLRLIAIVLGKDMGNYILRVCFYMTENGWMINPMEKVPSTALPKLSK